MARAVGETSPVLLTAGFTKEMNANPFSGPQTSLPLYIFSYVRYPQANMVARAFGAGLALMIMVLVLFALARLIGGKAPGQLTASRSSAAWTGRLSDEVEVVLLLVGVMVGAVLAAMLTAAPAQATTFVPLDR